MKKLIIMLFLGLGTMGFSKDFKIDPPVGKDGSVGCCTVGYGARSFTSCGYSFEPLCDRARTFFCMMNACTPATIYGIGGGYGPNSNSGGCGSNIISSADCGCGGSNSNGNVIDKNGNKIEVIYDPNAGPQDPSNSGNH